MHVISRKILLDFSRLHTDAVSPLDTWYRATKKALWTNFHEVREIFPHADQIGECVVFNIGGNKYRLVARIRYAAEPAPAEPRFRGKLFVLHVLTHQEYDANQWKKDCSR